MDGKSYHMSKNEQTFTINSFTQNLASVLLDTSRPKSEVNSFFVRQWGDSFVPKNSIKDSAPSIPKVNSQQFSNYLATTAKNHRKYVKARKLLRKVLTRHSEKSSISDDEVPDIFYSSLFDLSEPSCFGVIFLEPQRGESDKLDTRIINTHEVEQNPGASKSFQHLSRPESCGSLSSLQSLQNILPVEAYGSRYFRPYQTLNNRLEFYHDTVSLLLNNHLTNKGDEFWRTLNSYGAFHSEINHAIHLAQKARSKIKQTQTNICRKSSNIVQLQYAKENRQLILNRLFIISALREISQTVQMLLNQGDFPKALECIATAQDVLYTELRGVLCFRHLNSQLDEMIIAISKMLQEEFLSIIQKEFAKPLENEAECGYQETQLGPVILGLLYCQEFSFIQVFQSEIVEAVKSNIRQIVKNSLIENDVEYHIIGLDPTNLLGRINRISYENWIATIKTIIHSLILFCRRIMSIEDLSLECIQNMHTLTKLQYKSRSNSSLSRSRTPQITPQIPRKCSLSSLSSALSLTTPHSKFNEEDPADSRDTGISMLAKSDNASTSSKELEGTLELSTDSNDGTPANYFGSKLISEIPTDTTCDNGTNQKVTDVSVSASNFDSANSSCLQFNFSDLNRVRSSISQLFDFAILTCEKRISKLISDRLKENESALDCTPESFSELCKLLILFQKNCRRIKEQFDVPSSSTNDSKISNGGIKTGNIPFSAAPTQTSLRSPIDALISTYTAEFLFKYFEKKRKKLGDMLDSESWQEKELPSVYQRLICKFEKTHTLSDVEENNDDTNVDNCANDPSNIRCSVSLNDYQFIVIESALLLLRFLAQYCDLLILFSQFSFELLLNVIDLLKNFNSRTCQLILGAGALQLIGLKTISVKNLALAARSLQVIIYFIPIVKEHFARNLPDERKNSLRHFDSVQKDYNDHINEIDSKMLSVMESHLVTALQEWKVEAKPPSQSFQLVIKQIGKFYSGYSAIFPPTMTTAILHKIHTSFKLYLRQHLQLKGVTPHDSLAYGMACQDFEYYMENMKAFPNCESFPADNLGSVLKPT